mmetsp:Transcript_73477/g.143704  ORF Transcript_73477/g.143704 Transcript_73477/m.143704 type:complete len:222 (+) Transcript_73477:1060-1725(+)
MHTRGARCLPPEVERRPRVVVENVAHRGRVEVVPVCPQARCTGKLFTVEYLREVRVVRDHGVCVALGKGKASSPEGRELGLGEVHGVGRWHVSRHPFVEREAANDRDFPPAVDLRKLLEIRYVRAQNGFFILRLPPLVHKPNIPILGHQHVRVDLQTEPAVGFTWAKQVHAGSRSHRTTGLRSFNALDCYDMVGNACTVSGHLRRSIIYKCNKFTELFLAV